MLIKRFSKVFQSFKFEITIHCILINSVHINAQQSAIASIWHMRVHVMGSFMNIAVLGCIVV